MRKLFLCSCRTKFSSVGKLNEHLNHKECSHSPLVCSTEGLYKQCSACKKIIKESQKDFEEFHFSRQCTACLKCHRRFTNRMKLRAHVLKCKGTLEKPNFIPVTQESPVLADSPEIYSQNIADTYKDTFSEEEILCKQRQPQVSCFQEGLSVPVGMNSFYSVKPVMTPNCTFQNFQNYFKPVYEIPHAYLVYHPMKQVLVNPNFMSLEQLNNYNFKHQLMDNYITL